VTRAEAREFLELGIISLFDVTYGTGRISEWNSNRLRTYPMAWIESLRVTTELTPALLRMDTWRVRIHIADRDIADSIEEQYEAIIDDCDYYAQQLLKYYSDYIDETQVLSFKRITLSNITRDPFIKKNADCLTGVMLSFDMTAPDTSEVCPFTGPEFDPDYACGAVLNFQLLAIYFPSLGATPDIVPAGYDLQIYISQPYPVSKTVRFNDMRLLMTMPAGSDQTTFLANENWDRYITVWGDLIDTLGEKIYIWARYASTTDLSKGPFFKVEITVV